VSELRLPKKSGESAREQAKQDSITHILTKTTTRPGVCLPIGFGSWQRGREGELPVLLSLSLTYNRELIRSPLDSHAAQDSYAQWAWLSLSHRSYLLHPHTLTFAHTLTPVHCLLCPSSSSSSSSSLAQLPTENGEYAHVE